MADRPFVDTPPGSLDLAWSAARHAADAWSLSDPTLLRLGMNGMFVAGGVVLRVARVTAPPEAALALAAVLADAGVVVPAPVRADVVRCGELTVTAWEYLEAVEAEPDWRAIGQMVATVHSLPESAIPADYPVPPGERFAWWQFDDLLAELDDALDDAARSGLVRTIERHRRWADGVERVVCHGDVHPGNVVMTADGPVLIDWDLMCLGPIGWDHAMLLRLPRWGWPARWYDEFAAGYGQSLADDATANSLADLRLVAATLMRLRAGRADPQAMPEAQRRLAYWRNPVDAPPWRAV